MNDRPQLYRNILGDSASSARAKEEAGNQAAIKAAFVDAATLALHLGACQRTVRNWTKAGAISSIRRGRGRRVLARAPP